MTNLRIYVATSLSNAAEAERVALMLEGEGVVITSRWHRSSYPPARASWRERTLRLTLVDPVDRAARRMLCEDNLRDIRSSDGVLFMPHPDCRGSLVEVGYALGLGQVVFALGDRLSTTLMADGCEWVADEAELRARLHRGAR